MNNIRIEAFVQESLAAADPFYRGPHRGQAPPPDEDIRRIDPRKTRRDLGRDESPGVEIKRRDRA